MSHAGTARRVMSLLVMGALQVALGQPERVSLAVSGVVRFELGAAEVVAGAACPLCAAVAPVPGASVALQIERLDARGATTIEVVAATDTAVGALTLQVRFSGIGGSGATPWSTAWLALTDAPVEAFALPRRTRGDRAGDRIEVVPEYRLLPTGREPAGTYLVRVLYRVRETGASGSHDVAVTVPPFLSIRAVDAAGSPVGGGLSFDLGRDPQAYVDAVVSGRPLQADDRGFDRVEVATNAAGGYRITVTLEEIGGSPAGSERLRERVMLDGLPAHGRVFLADRPTGGLRTLLRREGFTMALDGSEPAGAHRFLITFRGVAHP